MAAAPVAPATHAIAAAPPQISEAVLKQNRAAAVAMAEVAKLTDEQRTERRAKASKEVSAIAQVAHAVWPTQSTLQVDLKQSDGKDANLITEVCSILTQYEELRLTRLQLDPPPGSTASVRWGQCQ
jgi:hypothetical protein